ncbi:MAG: hypothetical protein K2X01_05860 [Cyanobacteria bacterium]|nr:hypothetical protein [Cyanobacteriota bacterium]
MISISTKLTPQSKTPLSLSKALPQFSGAAGLGMIPLSPATARVDSIFQWLGKSRTREMLLEDLVGFGVLRTGMDLGRGYFYGNNEINWPAGRERILREVCSIFTDNVSSGLAAFALGYVLDRKLGSFSNKFTDFSTLELFQQLAASSPNTKAFTQNLAKAISPEKAARIEPLIYNLVAKAAEKGSANTAMDAATAIAKTLGKGEFDVTLAQGNFSLDKLLGDLAEFSGELRVRAGKKLNQTPKAWQQEAEALLGKTLKVKRWKMSCLAVGAVLTLLVPLFNTWLTKKIDKIDYYPGEIGLNGLTAKGNTARGNDNSQFKGQAGLSNSLSKGALKRPRAFSQFERPVYVSPKKKTWAETHMPFVNQSLKEGKLWPLLLALVPLPAAIGLVDTVNKSLNLPGKGFFRRLRNMYDFKPGFPFTTQQQMASMFAFLITSRLLNSRSGNEYRERLVDSFLGWGLWIFGTPIIKQWITKAMDKNAGTQLLKTVGGKQVMRSRAEIERLLSADVAKKTLSRNIWVGAISTVATMLLLGIIEPYIAIKWTEANSEKNT